MVKKFVDWHSHTIYSDGLDTPETVVRNSHILGIDSLAITDHDTLKGYAPAAAEAKRYGMDLIPGVEVSTEIYHILGLGINPDDSGFNEFLTHVQKVQKGICGRRIELLQQAGYPINLTKLEAAFPHSRLGKHNILLAMMQDEECRSMLERNYAGLGTHERFLALLGTRGIAGKVPKKEIVTSEEAIRQIHAAEGYAIVAHPFKEAHTPAALDTLLAEGLDGLEIQPNFGERNGPFIEYAHRHGLRITYGSDYHGSGFTARPLLGRATKGFDNTLDSKAFFNGRSVHA